MTHTTDITAARDLKDLVDKKILKPMGEDVHGSISYSKGKLTPNNVA